MRILRHLWLPALLALYVLLTLSMTVGEHGLLHLRKLHQEQRSLETEAVTLLRENEEVRDRIARLQKDDEFFEKVVREELKFVKKGELVYLFRSSPESAEQEEVTRGGSGPN